MNIRLYNAQADYSYIESWIEDERTHALWCANLVPYPLSEDSLSMVLNGIKGNWGAEAYVVTANNDIPIGFFAYSVNLSDKSGFLQFVILDDKQRGNGTGTQMLEKILQYAFIITKVTSVRLCVFDVNERARRCYAKAGFQEVSLTENAFVFKDEQWGRCSMVVTCDKDEG